MNIAVIAPLGHVHGEHENAILLLEAGLPNYHLRKPRLSVAEMQAWVNKIPLQYRRRITLHAPLTTALELGVGGVHLRESDRAGFSADEIDNIIERAEIEGLRVSASVHTVEDALTISDKLLYVFLSQAFNSESKPQLIGTIENWNLPVHRPCNIYALGGINESNISKAASYGVNGVAILGAVWHGTADPLSNFIRLRDQCKKVAQLS